MPPLTSAETGIVFNVQRYSLHDGPGIRTVVFLKGCPLRCAWCCNPESHKAQPELAFNPSRCLGARACGRCLAICPAQAIAADDEGRISQRWDACQAELDCVAVCPAGARKVYGERLSVADVLREVEADELFYARSGGGLTLSGGEPLAQPAFALALLRAAQARHLHTALSTSGHVPWETLAAACAHLDVLLYDLKHADPEAHERLTGVSNARILRNLGRIRESFPKLPLQVRTPVIPGVNDDQAALEAIGALVPEGPGVSWVQLPYHRLGRPKYAYLGRRCPSLPGGDEVQRLPSGPM